MRWYTLMPAADAARIDSCHIGRRLVRPHRHPLTRRGESGGGARVNQYPPRQDSQDPNGQPTWPYLGAVSSPTLATRIRLSRWRSSAAAGLATPSLCYSFHPRRCRRGHDTGRCRGAGTLFVRTPERQRDLVRRGHDGSTGTDAETFKLETFLSLTQDGTKLAGSGELCSVGTSNISFTVSGTFTGHNLVMTWTLAGSSPGAASTSTESVTGRGTDSTLVLNSTDASGYYSSTLKHGSHAAFTSDCKSVTV